MILFCEYAILESHRESFGEWVRTNRGLWLSAELLENVGQPGVYVEIWRSTGEQEAAAIQKERLGRRSDWRAMEEWVKGGREGIRCWTFRPLIQNE